MRIGIICNHFPPDVNSTGQLIAKLAGALARRGHEISVLSTFPHYDTFRIWPDWRGHFAQRDRVGDVDVTRLWVYAPGKKTMTRRLLNYLSFAALAGVAGFIERNRPDVILATNGSFFSGVASTVAGRFGRVPFVYNIQDLYPEVPILAGQLTNPLLISGLRRIERFMYERAAHLTVITPSFRESIVGKGVPECDVSIIPNFVDSDFIRPLPKVNDFSRKHDLDEKLVVTHAGNLGYVYELNTLLEVADRFRSRDDVVFLIVGQGVDKAGLEEEARRRDLPNVLFMPFQPAEDLPWLRASSDVQVALYRPGAARHSMPSKIYEIMASGRPVLASAEPGSDVRNVIEQADCGLCVAPDSPNELADALGELCGSATLRERMGAAGRTAALSTYTLEPVLDAYEKLLTNVAAKVC